MNLKLEVYSALCATETFEINGIQAFTFDFGKGYDACPKEAPDYGCGKRVFERIPATNKVLSKYGIDVDEYNEICDQLEEKLSFGYCEWCV